MHVNEHIDQIEREHGETRAAAEIATDLKGVLRAMRRLVTGLTELTWVTAGYGWLTLVAPILVAAPAYFAGNLSFGGMMMAAGAFIQVQSSLRWFVDNFSTIADWRATLAARRRFPPRPDQQRRTRRAESRSSVTMRKRPPRLLQLNDDALLEAVQRQTFRFFWEGAEPSSFLARDRYHQELPIRRAIWWRWAARASG